MCCARGTLRTMRTHVLLSGCLALTLCVPALAQDADQIRVLDGYLTAPATAALLMVDGRRVLIHGTSFDCASGAGAYQVDNGVPRFLPGAELAVYGSWKKKEQAFVATQVCQVRVPERVVEGSAVIDNVAVSGSGTVIEADGRQIDLPAGKDVLVRRVPLPPGTAPAAGLWFEYTARRHEDGRLLLESGLLRETVFGPAFLTKSKVVGSTNRSPVPLKDAVLPFYERHFQYRSDERLTRVGESLLPSWQRALPDQANGKVNFRFFLTNSSKQKDCIALSDRTVLLPEATEKELPQDDQLAAVLVACEAQLIEQQLSRYLPKEWLIAGATTAGLYALPLGIGLVPLVFGATYESRAETALSNQMARVAVAYLRNAHYDPSVAPETWEMLASKHGQVKLSAQPGAWVNALYRALAVEEPSAKGASALGVAVSSTQP